jgi:hypothetical protein
VRGKVGIITGENVQVVVAYFKGYPSISFDIL